MKRALSVLVLSAACMAAASPVAAQRIDSPYRFLDHNQFVGVFAGQLRPAEGPVQLGPQPAPIAGVNWGIRVSGPIVIGVEIAYSPSSRTVRDTVFVAADSVFRAIGETDMHLVSVMGLLRLNITGPRTWHGLQPFLLTGVGAVVDFASQPVFQFDNEEPEELPVGVRYDFGTTFAGQVGAGVDWFPVNRVSLRLDSRALLWKLGVPDAFLLTQAGQTLPRSDWANNFVVAAGVSFHF
jgi:opacity protein-like surface antigen